MLTETPGTIETIWVPRIVTTVSTVFSVRTVLTVGNAAMLTEVCAMETICVPSTVTMVRTLCTVGTDAKTGDTVVLCPPATHTTWPLAVIPGAVVVTEPPPAAGALICETNTGLTVVLCPPTIHITWPVAVMPGAVVVTDPPPPAPATMATFTVERMVTTVFTTFRTLTEAPATIDTKPVPESDTLPRTCAETDNPGTTLTTCVPRIVTTVFRTLTVASVCPTPSQTIGPVTPDVAVVV